MLTFAVKQLMSQLTVNVPGSGEGQFIIVQSESKIIDITSYISYFVCLQSDYLSNSMRESYLFCNIHKKKNCESCFSETARNSLYYFISNILLIA